MLGVRLSFASMDRKPAFGRKTAGFCLKLCKIALYKGQINHKKLFKLFLKYSYLDSRFPYNFDRDFTLGCVRLRTFVTQINTWNAWFRVKTDKTIYLSDLWLFSKPFGSFLKSLHVNDSAVDFNFGKMSKVAEVNKKLTFIS